MRTLLFASSLIFLCDSNRLLGQFISPSDLPPALQKYFLLINAGLNQTLYPENGTLAENDPELHEILTRLYQASFPAIDIIADRSIPNNTRLNFSAIQQFNQIGLRLFNILSSRILIPSRIPLEIEFDAMKDIINYIELPGKSIDNSFGEEVQLIIDGIVEKLIHRRIIKYHVIGINSTVADAQSRSNYILIFAGLRDLSDTAFQATIVHEIGHGELEHIPQGTLARIFNDF